VSFNSYYQQKEAEAHERLAAAADRIARVIEKAVAEMLERQAGPSEPTGSDVPPTGSTTTRPAAEAGHLHVHQTHPPDEQWEVMSMHELTTTYAYRALSPPGWEPFAVTRDDSGTMLWLRRKRT